MFAENLAKVWPLRPGVEGGRNHLGQPVALQPGVAGFMAISEAQEAVARGDVQLMAGETPDSLRTPQYDTREAVAQGPAQESASSPTVEVEDDQEPRRPAQVRRPRRKKTYARSDITAGKPSA